jgi:hypothetical protein
VSDQSSEIKIKNSSIQQTLSVKSFQEKSDQRGIEKTGGRGYKAAGRGWQVTHKLSAPSVYSVVHLSLTLFVF